MMLLLVEHMLKEQLNPRLHLEINGNVIQKD